MARVMFVRSCAASVSGGEHPDSTYRFYSEASEFGNGAYSASVGALKWREFEPNVLLIVWLDFSSIVEGCYFQNISFGSTGSGLHKLPCFTEEPMIIPSMTVPVTGSRDKRGRTL